MRARGMAEWTAHNVVYGKSEQHQSSKGAALMLRFRPTKVGGDSEKRTKSGPY